MPDTAPNAPEHERVVQTTLKTETVSDRILTVPNVITFIRIAMIPVFLWVLATRHILAAAILFGLIAGTDFIDGKIARRFNQVSALGKMLDPVADRLLIIAAVIGIIIQDLMPLVLIVVLGAREILVTIVSLGYKAVGVQLEVRYVGKWAAALTMFCIPVFVASTVLHGTLSDVLWVAGWMLGIAAAICGYTSIVFYLVDGRRALAERRAATPEGTT